MKTRINIQLIILTLAILQACTTQPAYKNTKLSVDERVDDLVSQMTVAEKISQMSHLAPGIERLGIVPYEPNFDNTLMNEEHPDYSEEEAEAAKALRKWENPEEWEVGECMDGGWWNEALHGVARAGLATAFPQSIGLGSTWNPEIIQKMTDVTSTEARIHSNVYGKKLTYWSPTINILRDPRWGRNEESYTEDPYLLSRMAVAFVKGMQGNDPKYLKAISTPKHFVANNSEYNRHDGSADVSERFLREYYLPAFKAAIMEGGAYSVMSAYNAVNGIPVSANKWLLTDILRDEWGFEGYVVSDCGAVSDIVHKHKYETDPEKAVAMAVKAGLDLECETCETEQFLYDKYLPGAFEKGYITEEEIDVSVKRLFRARMLLGEFDPPANVSFNSIPQEKLDSKEHRELALQIARESLVLLKNDNTLPLNKDNIKKIAVIGPNANITELGGYSGSPSIKVSPFEGIKTLLGEIAEVKYELGCSIAGTLDMEIDYQNMGNIPSIIGKKLEFDFGEKEYNIEFKDETIAIISGDNINKTLEAEYQQIASEIIITSEKFDFDAIYDGEVLNIIDYSKLADETEIIAKAVELAKNSDVAIVCVGTNLSIANEADDRENLDLPGNQLELIQKVFKANPNTVLVLINGMSLQVNWLDDHVPAIVEAWYPGQSGGTAIAEVLFGAYNPGGKLPVTFYKNLDEHPNIGEYDITRGHSYWFYEHEVLYPFGYGLSYTTFDYSNLVIDNKEIAATESNQVKVELTIKNTGEMKGDEVVQLYIKDLESSVIQPAKRLKKFERISLDKGESKIVSFTLSNEDFSFWDEKTCGWIIESGDFEVQIGASSQDIRLKDLVSAE